MRNYALIAITICLALYLSCSAARTKAEGNVAAGQTLNQEGKFLIMFVMMPGKRDRTPQTAQQTLWLPRFVTP